MARQGMAEEGIDAVIVRGSSVVRGDGASFRFLTDFPNINIPLVLIFFRDQDRDPILLVESRFQAEKAERYSWVRDVRLSANFLDSLLVILREKELGRARVGTDGFDRFPFLWYQRITDFFPDLTLVDFGTALKKLRQYKSPEAIRLVKNSAALVDLAFKEGVKTMRPGRTEWEVIARIDFVLKGHGVEKSFNIISQGPKTNGYIPSGKKIARKGMVFVEITACYGGYWTQLARAVSLGKPSTDLRRLHRVAVTAIKEGLAFLKPGYRVSKSMGAMDEYVKRAGCEVTPVYGHIVGIDMVEDRPSPKNEAEITPGMVFIVHPWPVLGRSSLLWGETYLVTEKGNERLNKVGDELIVL